MSEAFVKIDLHGLRQEEAMKVIDKAIASSGSTNLPSNQIFMVLYKVKLERSHYTLIFYQKKKKKCMQTFFYVFLTYYALAKITD